MTGLELPAILAIAGTATSVLSAGFGAVSAMGQASYQSKLAAMNAQIERENQVRSINEASIAAQEQDLATRAVVGDELMTQAQSGLSVNSGSSRRAVRDIRLLGRKDAMNIRQSGELEKFNSAQREFGFLAERNQANSARTNAAISGVVDVGSTLLSGAQLTRRSLAVSGPRPNTRRGPIGGTY